MSGWTSQRLSGPRNLSLVSGSGVWPASRLNNLGGVIPGTYALIVMLLALLYLCPGCGTLAAARSAKGTGARRTYDASADKVWDAIPLALKQLGLKLASSKKSDGCVLATAGVSGWSWGERIAVFVEEISPSRTEVEVVSKKVLATNVTARDWQNPILNQIEDVLRGGHK